MPNGISVHTVAHDGRRLTPTLGSRGMWKATPFLVLSDVVARPCQALRNPNRQLARQRRAAPTRAAAPDVVWAVTRSEATDRECLEHTRGCVGS
jgi:hypothetical protein